MYFGEVMLKLKADIYGDKDYSPHWRLIFSEHCERKRRRDTKMKCQGRAFVCVGNAMWWTERDQWGWTEEKVAHLKPVTDGDCRTMEVTLERWGNNWSTECHLGKRRWVQGEIIQMKTGWWILRKPWKVRKEWWREREEQRGTRGCAMESIITKAVSSAHPKQSDEFIFSLSPSNVPR